MMSVWTRKPGPFDAGPGQLLGHHHVVAEVGDPGAAVLLGDVEAEQALRAGLGPEVAGDDAVLLPLVVEGDDLLLQEGADGLAERLVLRLEDRTVGGHQDTHSFIWDTSAAGSSPTGRICRFVTPDSWKAAIRSFT